MDSKVKGAFRHYVEGVSKHFGLIDDEVSLHLSDFTQRVEKAKAGDVIASKKLLAYLRSCLMSGCVPDNQVARWAACCLFEVTHHDVSADKAFSLVPETGRPSNGGIELVKLLTWEDVEVIRVCQGLNKTDAITVYQEQRQSLADALWITSREYLKVEAVTTLTRQYREGAQIVKKYIAETGQKPPAF